MSLIVFYDEGRIDPADMQGYPWAKVPVVGDPHDAVMVVNGKEVEIPDLPDDLRAFIVAVKA
jgi:hypothetical protein